MQDQYNIKKYYMPHPQTHSNCMIYMAFVKNNASMKLK